MCGRFLQTSKLTRYASLFNASAGVMPGPRYNIAPTMPILACRLSEMGWRELVLLRWGLIPSWSKDPKTGYSTINARAETVAIKPAYRSAFKKRRCLIPADGFYEWKAARPRKLPYFIHRKDGEPFAFAGLWEHWHKEGESIESATIIVTTANSLVSTIHDRMPVIVDPKDYAQWLDPESTQDDLLALLKPCPAKDMEAYPVGLAVNTPSNDGPELIEPLKD